MRQLPKGCWRRWPSPASIADEGNKLNIRGYEALTGAAVEDPTQVFHNLSAMLTLHGGEDRLLC
jgi:hypothetical protein